MEGIAEIVGRAEGMAELEGMADTVGNVVVGAGVASTRRNVISSGVAA